MIEGDFVERGDHTKAAFLQDYRDLCEKYGLMVIMLRNGDVGLCYCVASLSRPSLDQSIHEMLLEKTATILEDDS